MVIFVFNFLGSDRPPFFFHRKLYSEFRYQIFGT